MRRKLTCSIAYLTLVLTACGGGGGGSSELEPVTPPEPTPVLQSYELSGTITASPSQAADSDTNNPTRASQSNNSPSSAQSIGNPITLGGYVNQPGTGAPGRSRLSGDIDDFFRVDLLAGQTVTLLVADFETADADLALYDAEGEFVDFSAEIGNVESLVIPRDGSYLVNVYAFTGATNYILAIGQPGTSVESISSATAIVPWQAIIEYTDETVSANLLTQADSVIHRMGMEQRAGGRGRHRLMALRRTQVSQQQREQRLGTAQQKLSTIDNEDLRARFETLMTIKSLRGNPRVRNAQPNYRVRTLATPNDELYPLQWHFPLIGLPEAWDTTTGSQEVIVAVVDTGVLDNHPDLAGQLVAGYDFVRNLSSAADGDGIDDNPRDPGDFFGRGSSSFHGTHITGIVAARGDNQQGVAGTAYNARVMPVRALGSDGGTSYDVDQAIRFAAGLDNDSGTVPPQPAAIINLSLGGAPFSRATQELIDEVRRQGIVIVAAAGNQASSQPSYPASYDGVISVSALDAQRQLAPYSNTGPNIDVAAPGGNTSVDINGDGFPDGILSTSGSISDSGVNFENTFLNGTSMAAPHVAGVLALMKSVNADLSPADIDALLATGSLSDDLGAVGRDDLYGHGVINAQRAVLAALEASGATPSDNPRLTASASSLGFSSTSSSLDLALRNGGNGALTLERLTVSQPWLKISSISVDDDTKLGTYRVTVDRDGLEVGAYAAEINAESNVNSLNVSVLLSVGDNSTGADVGVIYVLVYDTVKQELLDQFVTGGNSAQYPFVFANIPAGSYEIIAGTDTDNDSLICDPGEACGAWLTVDQPIQLDLQGDKRDLNFPVEYQVAIPRLNAAGSKAIRPDKRAGLAREPAPVED